MDVPCRHSAEGTAPTLPIRAIDTILKWNVRGAVAVRAERRMGREAFLGLVEAVIVNNIDTTPLPLALNGSSGLGNLAPHFHESGSVRTVPHAVEAIGL
jgi:hypothetical protein